MTMLLFILYLLFSFTVLARGMKPLVWEAGSALYWVVAVVFFGMSWLPLLLIALVVVGISALMRVEPLRMAITDVIYKKAAHAIPKLSKTEEEALNAGDTWIEKDIFMGEPDWDKLHGIRTALTKEEQAFLDNETQTLCDMLDEWSITQEKDLPEPVWHYIKSKGFLGMVIGKEYGGKGFSARAHSDVVMKIASRSGVAAVTVMVPNSLGPGELLTYYGTDEQKETYLPNLARGIDIPCFALTEPGAGSDATSIESEAVVIEKTVDGKPALFLKINLDKRWITLAPIATLIGLAVHVKDPDGLLKGIGQEGITCVLIPRDTEHLEIGNRHLPADQPFMNGTVRGKGIIVPIETIIGGQKNAGQGWRMLVECLSIGRSISLPALGAASSSVSYLTTGAFAQIRRQFGVAIGQFEGVQEKLAQMAGLSYLISGTRLLTVAAVNEHKKPSVASAITKYFNTELARIVVNDAMDVHAGRAVVVGPRNYLTGLYLGLPISITVEGANVMSRNLLIFGQGSMACHPYVRDEFYAIAQNDKAAFHRLLWQHIAYFSRNAAKALCSAWTGGLLLQAPRDALKRDYQRLARLSHAFAWIADLALITLGGDLKRKERLSARLADAMSYLYMAMGALRQFEENQGDDQERAHARWALSYCYYHTQKALLDFCRNYPIPLLGKLVRFLVFPWGQTMRYPSDTLDAQLAMAMMNNNSFRQRLKQRIFLSGRREEPVDRMEDTLQLLLKNKPLYQKIKELKRYKFAQLQEKLQEKVNQGELTLKEMQAIAETEKACWDAIQVDEFTFESMKHKTFASVMSDSGYPMTANTAVKVKER